MRRADVFVIHTFGFLGGIGKRSLGLSAERQVNGYRDFEADRAAPRDGMADGFELGIQDKACQRRILAEQAEQEMLRFNLGTAELTGLRATEEDGSPGLFGIPFEHI